MPVNFGGEKNSPPKWEATAKRPLAQQLAHKVFMEKWTLAF